MAATDFVYDPTGESPDNLIANEVHSLEHSAAVFPLHGAFYRERSIIEVSNNGTDWLPLEPMTQYRFSPLWMRATAALGKEIHSYVVIYGEWKECRITYQTLGQFEDRDLLEQVASATFDRKNPSEWLKIRGCMSFNPIIRKTEWLEKTPLEVLNTGIEGILDELRQMTAGCDKATLQQVTNLEIRQSNVEDEFEAVQNEFTLIGDRFDNIQEQYEQLEDFFINGWGGNTAYAGGYLYSSDGELQEHTIDHNLGSEDVLTTFWILGEDGRYHTTLVDVEILSENQIKVSGDLPTKLIGVIESLSGAGYRYESQGPQTEHSIIHNLDTGFPRVGVYRLNSAGNWEKSIVPVRFDNKSVLELTTIEPETLKVLIEPPIPNSFLWASDTPSDHHLVHHRLSTMYLGAVYWLRTPDGAWEQDLVGASLLDPGRMAIDLAEQRDIRVVLSPVALEGPSWEQNLHTRVTHLEEKYDGLSNALDQLRADLDSGSVGGGTIGDSHIYMETAPKTIHVVEHKLDVAFVSLACWIRDPDDGVWREHYLQADPIDRNSLSITLSMPAALRVRVRGEDL